ncbi:hypothetical protein K5V21_13840 [Clostridium sardiniense]|uniref:Uncharacterized protein n=1 Tax=Clostridium sardiniense TaxID=29369 RepID=A0ABS7L0E0_CLOSR|nr:hypothetical protein [Clostridium sardiniense]MBY0756526.1 hypothetical protein [Clostridium sardiniense]MDQ0460274.1 hypothetical protein [Clostridium sardiniense]
MRESMEVKSNPIQRNKRDVATELTKLYVATSNRSDFEIEEIQQAYIRFYATVSSVENVEGGYGVKSKFASLIPEIL